MKLKPEHDNKAIRLGETFLEKFWFNMLQWQILIQYVAMTYFAAENKPQNLNAKE